MPVFIENVAHLSVINEISGEFSDIVDLSYELNMSDFLADRQKIQTYTLKGQSTRVGVFSEVTFASFFLFLACDRNCTFL